MKQKFSQKQSESVHNKNRKNSDNAVRLDKWLWAARFYKTRSLAKQMIEHGKVQVNGAKTKSSREIQVGDVLIIRQGWEQKEVSVLALIEKRVSATEASALYRESEESIQLRQSEAEKRKLANTGITMVKSKPGKKQRRELAKAKRSGY